MSCRNLSQFVCYFIPLNFFHTVQSFVLYIFSNLKNACVDSIINFRFRKIILKNAMKELDMHISHTFIFPIVIYYFLHFVPIHFLKIFTIFFTFELLKKSLTLSKSFLIFLHLFFLKVKILTDKLHLIDHCF